jgi:tetratricopeptide (TPR) repeat protein
MATTDTPLTDRLEQALAVYDELRGRIGPGRAREEVSRSFPEVADRLRRLWNMVRVAPNTPPPARVMATGVGGRDPHLVPGYELLEELGQGGVGVVYKARQLGLGRLVAVKLLKCGTGSSPADLGRFRAEARAAARLHHPNIVSVLEAGPDDPEEKTPPYIVQEYVEGPTLAECLAGGPLRPQAAAELVEALARAAAVAHSRGIVHRDLKPGNILLSRWQDDRAEVAGLGVPKVTDFGLAKWLNDSQGLSLTGEVIGTPAYMAPEQAFANKDVGPAADVYALGVILYESLAGHRPFQHPEQAALLNLIRFAEPRPLKQAAPHVPRDLATITHKCLEKEPARRYGSAADLAEDLRRFLDGRPIKARPVGRVERCGRWCRRKPALASLILLALVSFFAVLSQWLRAEAGEALAVERLRSAEAARQDAEDSHAQTLRLVGEVVVFVQRIPQQAPDQGLPLDMLRKVEAQVQTLLRKRPTDLELLDLLSLTCLEQGQRHAAHKQTDQAVQAYRRAGQASQRILGLQPTGWRNQLLFLGQLLRRGSAHEGTGDPEAALASIRQAAKLSARLAQQPPRDAELRFSLATLCLHAGISLRRVGAPAESPGQIAVARQLFEGLVRESPGDPRYLVQLSITWYHLGHARRVLGQHDEALAAYRQAVQAQRSAFDRAPDVPEHRQQLSLRYSRLAYWLRLRGHLAEAAASLLEQKKLWPKDAAKLREISKDLSYLAALVGGGRGQLTPAEQQEHQRYLDLSEQVAQEAAAAQPKPRGAKP